MLGYKLVLRDGEDIKIKKGELIKKIFNPLDRKFYIINEGTLEHLYISKNQRISNIVNSDSGVIRKIIVDGFLEDLRNSGSVDDVTVDGVLGDSYNTGLSNTGHIKSIVNRGHIGKLNNYKEGVI